MMTVVKLDLERRLNQSEDALEKTLRDYAKRAARMVEQRYDSSLGRNFKCGICPRQNCVMMAWEVLNAQLVQEVAEYTQECWKQVTG